MSEVEGGQATADQFEERTPPSEVIHECQVYIDGLEVELFATQCILRVFTNAHAVSNDLIDDAIRELMESLS